VNVLLLGVACIVVTAFVLARLFKRQSKKPVDIDLSKRIARAKRKGRTSEQIEADSQQWLRDIRERGRQAFERDKQSALRAGSKFYLWRTSNDGDVCPACAKNNGKRFRWDKAAPHLHPGHSETCKEGYCRCYAEALLPE
jgi:hypothetical protein